MFFKQPSGQACQDAKQGDDQEAGQLCEENAYAAGDPEQRHRPGQHVVGAHLCDVCRDRCNLPTLQATTGTAVRNPSVPALAAAACSNSLQDAQRNQHGEAHAASKITRPVARYHSLANGASAGGLRDQGRSPFSKQPDPVSKRVRPRHREAFQKWTQTRKPCGRRHRPASRCTVHRRDVQQRCTQIPACQIKEQGKDAMAPCKIDLNKSKPVGSISQNWTLVPKTICAPGRNR